MNRIWLVAILLTFVTGISAQQKADSLKAVAALPEKKWFETISVRGYVQTRYNRLLETNPNLS
ncbi:MAG: hypothetical protein ACN4EP_07280, partial [Sediminibacterium sp.]